MSCLSSLGEKPPFSWFGSQDTLQFLMLGCEGAGKTTLLYKLKIDSWGKKDIVPTMRSLRMNNDSLDAKIKDPSYHYEEFTSRHVGKYGIWDVPGSEPLASMWPTFYRYLRIDALIYVVDCFSSDRENFDRISEARRRLHHLLNEDELRCAAVVLILNVRGSDHAATASGSGEGCIACGGHGCGLCESTKTSESPLEADPEDEEELHECFFEMLGVPEIQEAIPHRRRFFAHKISCPDASHNDQQWTRVLKDIHMAYQQVGEGSMPVGA